MTVYAFGAYGTNNVGDEAIFEGLRRIHPEARQIYINKTNKPNAVWYGDLNAPGDFDPGSHLIIGGGGLLYSDHAIRTMARLVGLVRENGGTATIEGLGCEALAPDYVEATKALFGMVDSITVRTTMSTRIVQELGFKCDVVNDYAFNLADRFAAATAARPQRGERLRVGIVTSGDAFDHDYAALCLLIRKYTVGEKLIEFVHIPHSKSYVDIRNNDEIVGLRIWGSIHIAHAERTALYSCLPYTDDIDTMAARYASLDAVICERFHGVIFSLMARLPALVDMTDRKNRSIVDDNPHSRLFEYEGAGEEALFAGFAAMIASVEAA